MLFAFFRFFIYWLYFYMSWAAVQTRGSALCRGPPFLVRYVKTLYYMYSAVGISNTTSSLRGSRPENNACKPHAWETEPVKIAVSRKRRAFFCFPPKIRWNFRFLWIRELFLVFINCGYMLFTKFPWRRDTKRTFRFSSQAAICLQHSTVEASNYPFLLLNVNQGSCLWKPMLMVFGLTRAEIEPKSIPLPLQTLYPLDHRLVLNIDSETKSPALSQNPAYATESGSFYA